MEEKEDWAEHKTIITLLLEAFGLTATHTVEDVLWAMGKAKCQHSRYYKFLASAGLLYGILFEVVVIFCSLI
jgi:hypothetical protein